MKNLNWILTVALCFFLSAAFSQEKGSGTISKINVYFPNSEVQAHKLNLNVQGVIVAVPLCDVTISKVDDHNFQFASKDSKTKIMRGADATTSVKLAIVHGTNDKILALLQSLQSEECGK